MASSSFFSVVLFPLLLFLLPSPTLQQRSPAAPPVDSCVGVFLSYSLTSRTRIHPFLPNDPQNQPFSFKAIATVVNTDSVPLTAWSLHVGLRPNTVLVSSSHSVLSDGSSLPLVLNSSGVSFSGFPNPDLKTAIETAGDSSQTQAVIDLVGSDFGVFPARNPPLPSSLSLDNLEFLCPSHTVNSSSIHTCCTRNPNFKRPNSSLSDLERPRAPADISITYDILQSFDADYLALVTIDNLSPLGRLDHWRLQWSWMRGEFIQSIRGAQTTISDSSECIFGEPGQYYKIFDFSKVVNCQRSPIFLDLPISMFNNSDIGRIPFCCRNGTILPTIMDPTQSKSSFQLNIKKMPPHLNRTDLAPPQNWRISGSSNALNPTFNCSPPFRVSRSEFPDPRGLPTTQSAILSWQIVCNITREKRPPRCCASFSGYYNDSVVPCRTCACGCEKNPATATCGTTSPAMLLPPEALLVPFENRTAKALAWAELKHQNVPNPLPCADNCGVSVNWHVFTDYRGGWSARITLFNWEDDAIPDWFVAIKLKNAYAGFEEAYSFNASAIGNDLIFMKGLEGLNYLVGEDAGKDPRDPGKMQTVISFTKRLTPGIDVLGGDGFPSKVIFNGEECALPGSFPANGGDSTVAGDILGAVIAVVVSLAVLMMGL